MIDKLISTPRYWINVAPPRSWPETINLSICGMPETLINKYRWRRVAKDDLILFYVTAPISGLIGYGKTIEILEGNAPLWSQELRVKHILYPLRIKISITTVLKQGDWQMKRIKPVKVTSFRRSLILIPNLWGIEYVSSIESASHLLS